MDRSVCKKISHAVPFLRTPESRAAKKYLARPYQHAVSILEALEGDDPVDGMTIAEALGLHPNTVYAILGALRKGGYQINETVEGASKMLKGERRVF